MAKTSFLTPQEHWKLNDYMQALQNAVAPSDEIDKLPTYESGVKMRIAFAKKAIQNLEAYMANQNK
jgi:hypothetical protein